MQDIAWLALATPNSQARPLSDMLREHVALERGAAGN